MAGSRGCWGPPRNVAAQLKRRILDDRSLEGQTKDAAALHKPESHPLRAIEEDLIQSIPQDIPLFIYLF